MGKLGSIGVVVGPKGRGTNLRAIVAACETGIVPAQVISVVSPIGDSPAVQFATEKGITVHIEPPRDEYGLRLSAALEGCELVCLAGYTRLLPTEVLRKFPDLILNIHPSLLPKYGGKGMYGIKVHEAVLSAGDTESGCSVHLVNEVYDDGAVLLQMRCPVEPGDTPETLAHRVLELEKVAFPSAIKLVLDGRTA